MKFAIIYHDADFDGKLSNETCRYWLGKMYPEDQIHSYGWDYGRPVPEPRLTHQLDHNPNEPVRSEWSLYDSIYIVDLSVDELMARPELRNKIVWIDHHKSAIEKWDHIGDVNKMVGYRIDGVAACRLCWQWFVVNDSSILRPSKSAFINRTVYEPELIRLAGEYDIWDHRDPDAKALQFGLRALSETDLGRLVENQFSGEPTGIRLDDVITQGRTIKSYCDRQNDKYSSACSQTIQWEGLTFCALNIGQRGNSDLLRGGIKPEHQACFAWRWAGNAVLVSLYHIEGHTDLDLSIIATKYGGGGHRGACGFRTTLTQLTEILK